MSKDKEKFDRKQQRTKKLMAFVVAPILFMIAGLMGLGIIDLGGEGLIEPIIKQDLVEIVSQIEVQCYNVNWFGQHGFQIVYTDSLIEIAEKLGEHDIDFTASEFYANQDVVDYLVVRCPHIDSKLDAPDVYDPNVGKNVVDKCLERKYGELNFKEFCAEFKI